MPPRSRILGAFLGLALGDALGLPFEGLSARRAARRFRIPHRFQLIGRTGFVSDDTEQSALLVAAVLSSTDDARCIRAFRRSMLGWFARLPFGIGGATLRACVRMALGFRAPGVRSAGNGAAMRAGWLGAILAGDVERRRRLGRAVAMLTHTDARAVDGALYVAELSALCVRAEETERASLVIRASDEVSNPAILAAIDTARASVDLPLDVAAERLGNTGFVIHTVALCTYCFIRFGDAPMEGIEACIRAGGDTDSHAAIVGGWLGALHGVERIPEPLVAHIHDGPFGPTHLRALAESVVRGEGQARWSWIRAMLRNLALYPVVLAHGVARLWPR